MSEHTETPSWWKNEDWLAVWAGTLFIVLVLTGIRPELPKFSWRTGMDLVQQVFAGANLLSAARLGLGYLVVAAAGIALMGGNLRRYLAGFWAVFLLAWLSQAVAGNAKVNDLGLEYVLFALALGLIINHTVAVPVWLREAVRTEFYIKTGLVILGAGILFEEILQAGALGIVQAVLVVAVVWYFCYWLSKKMRVDDEFSVMLSTAVSICGVSAAIAACGAIQGDKKKLSYVTSLVLVVAVPMMVLMPWLVKSLGLPELVGGAWLGGTLDTSGSVVAAGALISEPAMKTGVIVKFSQNVLIGVAAFLLSIWWTMRKGTEGGNRPSAAVIWQRFPKFVLGFIVASLVFSFLLEPELVKTTKKTLAGLRTTWFAMAFVCIGLETKFTELVTLENGRPAFAFIGAQAFNVIWTLALAFLLFGGILFAAPTIK
ncbi:MAG: putative sulfate exporter family transporter [Verrucomicrobia bacterium]|nr:putative sulfate exporter family transporter [Verrucomicrobiota bacterium]